MGLYLCRSRKGQRERACFRSQWSKTTGGLVQKVVAIYTASLFSEEVMGGERESVLVSKMGESVGGRECVAMVLWASRMFGENTGLLSYQSMTSGKFPYLHRALLYVAI